MTINKYKSNFWTNKINKSIQWLIKTDQSKRRQTDLRTDRLRDGQSQSLTQHNHYVSLQTHFVYSAFYLVSSANGDFVERPWSDSVLFTLLYKLTILHLKYDLCKYNFTVRVVSLWNSLPTRDHNSFSR